MFLRRGEKPLPDSIRHFFLAGTSLSHPLASMQTMSGFLTAYWRGDKKGDAWLYTLGIMGLTMGISYVGVHTGLEMGAAIGEVGKFTVPGQGSIDTVYDHALTWLGMSVGLSGLHASRHFLSSTLHRNIRAWTDGKVSSALLGGRGTLMHLTNIFQRSGGARGIELDNIDQRKSDCIKDAFGGALGLAMGLVSAVSTAAVAGYELWKLSRTAPGFEFLHDFGTLGIALAATAVTVGAGSYVAGKIGDWMTRVNMRMQVTEASYRDHANNMLRRSTAIAANNSQGVMRKINENLYVDVDTAWKKYNYVHTGFMAFKGTYNPISHLVSFLPALPNLATWSIMPKDFFGISSVVMNLMNALELAIDVKPAWATLKTNTGRATDMIRAIVETEENAALYKEKGISEFNYVSQHRNFGLTVANLELMHEGKEADIFMRARHFRVGRGEYAAVVGESGAGKTTLLKAAVGGLHYYGRGNIYNDSKGSVYYIPQETELEKLSLKQLMTLPFDCDLFTDQEVARMMDKIGLKKFAPLMHETFVDGKPWNGILSGGQKHRINLARAILVNPDLLLMDEPTAGLDPAWRAEFYTMLKRDCPDTTALVITHDDPLPCDRNGDPVFDTVLHIENGVLTQKTTSVYAQEMEDKQQREIQQQHLRRQARDKRLSIARHGHTYDV